MWCVDVRHGSGSRSISIFKCGKRTNVNLPNWFLKALWKTNYTIKWIQHLFINIPFVPSNWESEQANERQETYRVRDWHRTKTKEHNGGMEKDHGFPTLSLSICIVRIMEHNRIVCPWVSLPCGFEFVLTLKHAASELVYNLLCAGRKSLACTNAKIKRKEWKEACQKQRRQQPAPSPPPRTNTKCKMKRSYRKWTSVLKSAYLLLKQHPNFAIIEKYTAMAERGHAHIFTREFRKYWCDQSASLRKWNQVISMRRTVKIGQNCGIVAQALLLPVGFWQEWCIAFHVILCRL